MADTQENKGEKTQYGDCIGPESKYIKLITVDGFEFIIERELVEPSFTLKAMANAPSRAADECQTVNLKGIYSKIALEVCKYLLYKQKYTDSDVKIPEFPIDPKIAVELLLAANFLEV